MKLARSKHDPADLLGLFETGLTALGAITEQTWHNRLEVVAEGRASRFWRPDGALHEVELEFMAANESGPRDATREIFPGCPLIFQLTEALRASVDAPLRGQYEAPEAANPPALEVAEKAWRLQWPATRRWHLDSALVRTWHFSALLLVRCEIQAIDQHWSLHRLALSLPDGKLDEALAASVDLAQISWQPPQDIPWLTPDLTRLRATLRPALEAGLAGDLEPIRRRQEHYLRRELERIETYFTDYERELEARRKRQRAGEGRTKWEDRLAAAKAEHERRREDQVRRHEIRIIPHVDALAWIAETAWSGTITTLVDHHNSTTPATFVPRSRHWVVDEAN